MSEDRNVYEVLQRLLKKIEDDIEGVVIVVKVKNGEFKYWWDFPQGGDLAFALLFAQGEFYRSLLGFTTKKDLSKWVNFFEKHKKEVE